MSAVIQCRLPVALRVLPGLFATFAAVAGPPAPGIRLPAPATVSLCEQNTDRCVVQHLAAAQDLRAFLDQANAGVRDAELRIVLDPGRYTADPGLHLDGRALPARIQSVTIAGAAGGGTQLVGSLPLQAIGEPEFDEAGGSVSADLPNTTYPRFQPSQLTADNPGPFVPFDDAGPFELARWPRSGWAPFTADASAADARALKPADLSRMRRWAQEPAAWASGFLKYEWHAEHRGLATIDADAGLIVLEQSTLGLSATGRFRLMNLRSEFDAPREYWIDAPRGRLHMRPVPGTASSLRVATAVEPLLRLSNVHNFTLRDLVLGETRGHAIVVEQGTDVAIANVTVRGVGRSAIVVEGGQNVSIVGADIDNTGQHAVVLNGGDRETLRASRHRIEGSRIRRASQIVMTPSAAVRLLGVGQIVRDNTIEDSPHMAIYFDGNDHLIESNRIRRVCLDVNDAGAIYAGRDWTFRGNVIRGNLIADITRGDPRGSLSAIYLDDMLSGVTVERNLVTKVPHGVLIGGGRDNLVRGNVFIDVATPVHVDQRALEWASASVSAEGTMMTRLRRMPYRGRAWRSAYPELAQIDANAPAAPRGNVVIDNCQWNSGPMSVVELASESGRIEKPLALDNNPEPARVSAGRVTDTCREHIRRLLDR